MMSGTQYSRRFLRRFRKNEDGSPSVEFVILFPMFVVLLVSSVEMGLLMTRHAMLERGLDMAVREVRLNTNTQITEVQLQRMTCNAAGLIPNCDMNLRLEMRPIDLRFAGALSDNSLPLEASCTNVNKPFLPARTFTNGTANAMMMVRACGVFRPMMPTFGLGFFLAKGEQNHYRLVSSTAFVMEPV